MKIFIPTRGQKKTKLPPDPHRQNRQNLDAGGSVSSGGEGVAVIPENNTLEPRRNPTPAALGVLAKLSIQTAPDQPRAVAIPTNAVQLEPLTVWAAIHTAIPECVTIMRENKYLIAWLEYGSPSRGWVVTTHVSASRAALEQLVAAVAALEPDALYVAIKSAVNLHPEINPAQQEVKRGAAQLARFSRKEVSA